VNVWDREAVTKTHTAVQYSFRCQLEYQLHMVQVRIYPRTASRGFGSPGRVVVDVEVPSQVFDWPVFLGFILSSSSCVCNQIKVDLYVYQSMNLKSLLMDYT
jgi:hypothetical protein